MNRSQLAKTRFFRLNLVIAVFYVLAVALVSYFVPEETRLTPMTIFWALLPGLAIIAWIWNMGRYLMQMEDEYLRLLDTRKMLVATALTLAICGGWGLAELFAPLPRLPVFFVFPIWCVGLVAGQIFNRLTMGESGNGCP